MMRPDRFGKVPALCYLFCALLSGATGAIAHDEVIDFATDQWVKYNAEIVEHLARTCLIGSAYLANTEFVNGIIEYDVAVDGSRCFPGITFRATSPYEYENFYIRPHDSNLPDALQYTPVFNGVEGWQLYNGEGFTAAAEIPWDQWGHVLLEILGRQARVYLGGKSEPALIINDLKHDVVAGSVGIRSERRLAACFANFRVVKKEDLRSPPATAGSQARADHDLGTVAALQRPGRQP